MKLEDSEDLDIFTKNEFSTTATVTSANSPLTELEGIFDENYQDMFGGFNHLPTEGRKYAFQVQTLEAVGLKHGERLAINGTNYSIVSLQPKHDGKLTNIVLKLDLS